MNHIQNVQCIINDKTLNFHAAIKKRFLYISRVRRTRPSFYLRLVYLFIIFFTNLSRHVDARFLRGGPENADGVPFFFRVRLYVFFVLFSTRPKTSCTPFSFEAQHVAPAVATHHNQYTIKFDLFVLLRSIQFIGNCFQNEHFINSHVHSPINHT